MRSHADDKGWLGPADNPKDGNTYWGRSNVMLSFAMFAEVGEQLGFSLIRHCLLLPDNISTTAATWRFMGTFVLTDKTMGS